MIKIPDLLPTVVVNYAQNNPWSIIPMLIVGFVEDVFKYWYWCEPDNNAFVTFCLGLQKCPSWDGGTNNGTNIYLLLGLQRQPYIWS